MTFARFGSVLVVLAMTPPLSACGPGTMLGKVVDVLVVASDEQTLEIRNTSAMAIEILQSRNGPALPLAPNAIMAVRFRVLSLDSRLKVMGQPYYSAMSSGVVNHLEETDGLRVVDLSSARPTIYFRDSEGPGTMEMELTNCKMEGSGSTWETMKWSPSAHSVRIPPAFAGMSQAVCPP